MAIDDEYQGQLLKNTLSIRNIARRDTVDGGPLGIKIKWRPEPPKKGRDNDEEYPLVDNLDDFYVESPVFTMDVPELQRI